MSDRADSGWEFRYVIDHVPEPGKPQWTEWLQVQETGAVEDGKWPMGYRVDALSGNAVVQFRRAPVKCEAWINLAQYHGGKGVMRVYCDVPAGGKHPVLTEDPDDVVSSYPVHHHKGIWWSARSVPEEGE